MAKPNRREYGKAQNRQELVYLQLRDMIVTGELAPGSPLIESRLAEELEASRSVVRAALRRLELEGYLNSIVLNKYSRLIVTPLTSASVSELFQIMGALEGLAVSKAAELGKAVRDEIADEMEQLNQALLAASEGGTAGVVDAQDLHVRFHNVVVDAAAGPLLYAQIDRIRPQVERYERLYTHVLISNISDSVREHAAIIEALRAGRPEAAKHASEVNWQNGAARYERALARSGSIGRAAGMRR